MRIRGVSSRVSDLSEQRESSVSLAEKLFEDASVRPPATQEVDNMRREGITRMPSGGHLPGGLPSADIGPRGTGSIELRGPDLVGEKRFRPTSDLQ